MIIIMHELKKILLENIPETEHSKVDLEDDDCIYRKFYFDYLPNESAKRALMLFPNGEELYIRYLKIKSGLTKKVNISDDNLVELVSKYLIGMKTFLQYDNDDKTINFIESVDKIEIASKLQSFGVGENILHKNIYGSISEYLLDELPDDDAVLLLYDWSLEKTSWFTVTAYFLESFLNSIKDKNNGLSQAFDLWLSGKSDHYWILNNNLTSKIVLCK